MSQEDIRATITSLQQRLQAARQKELKEMGRKNLEEGKKFLAENQKKEGVKALPSGLQYKVLSQGSGKMPKAGDTVTVNYKGTLIDGTEFDSSYKRGQPASFQVNGVIKGWTEALQLMKEGDKWQLFIPSKLAYRESGMPPKIGPNSTLIFDVELEYAMTGISRVRALAGALAAWACGSAAQSPKQQSEPVLDAITVTPPFAAASSTWRRLPMC